jgi:hypothetical protein
MLKGFEASQAVLDFLDRSRLAISGQGFEFRVVLDCLVADFLNVIFQPIESVMEVFERFPNVEIELTHAGLAVT